MSPDAVERALRSGLDGAPGTAAAVVTAAGADRVLAGEARTRPVVPASNQKLLTALSLAEHVDPYERLATRVVVGEAPGELTLVADGGTLLAPGEGKPARGITRAKTGALLDVVTLSGAVQGQDGRVLVHSIVLSGVSGHTDEAKDRVDRTVAALAHST